MGAFVGRAMHGQHIAVRHAVMHECEDAFFHFARHIRCRGITISRRSKLMSMLVREVI